MLGPAKEILDLFQVKPSSTSFSYFFSQLQLANKQESKTCITLRKPRPKIGENLTRDVASTLADLLFPDLIEELNYDPSKRKSECTKRFAGKDMANSKKKKKNLKSDRVNAGKSSYRVLSPLHVLETGIMSHFNLNHQFRILMFGCAGSVASVDEISDDDLRKANRKANVKYNIDLINSHFDEIADEDIESNLMINKYIKQRCAKDQDRIQSLRRSPSSGVQASNIIEKRCYLYSVLNDTYDEMHQYPCLNQIDFSPNISDPLPKIKYIELAVILNLIANIELNSISLQFSKVIRTSIAAFKFLLKYSIKYPKKKYHLVGDISIVKFFILTQKIVEMLLRSLNLKKNFVFGIYLDFLTSQNISIDGIMDDIALGIAAEIDCGGWYAREFLKYRELTCGLKLHSFDLMLLHQCLNGSNEDTKPETLIQIARSYLNYQELYGIHISFTKDLEVEFSFTPLDEASSEFPIFPYFNMFTVCDCENMISFPS